MSEELLKSMRRTKLKQRLELERVLGVTFPTVNSYLTGKAYPRGTNRLYILHAAKILNDLVERGKLPLPEDYSPERRAAAVERLAIHIRRRYPIKNY